MNFRTSSRKSYGVKTFRTASYGTGPKVPKIPKVRTGGMPSIPGFSNPHVSAAGHSGGHGVGNILNEARHALDIAHAAGVHIDVEIPSKYSFLRLLRNGGREGY